MSGLSQSIYVLPPGDTRKTLARSRQEDSIGQPLWPAGNNNWKSIHECQADQYECSRGQDAPAASPRRLSQAAGRRWNLLGGWSWWGLAEGGGSRGSPLARSSSLRPCCSRLDLPRRNSCAGGARRAQSHKQVTARRQQTSTVSPAAPTQPPSAPARPFSAWRRARVRPPATSATLPLVPVRAGP
jgi:hypothetical protein